MKNQEKGKTLLNDLWGEWSVIHKNVEYLSCGEVEALGDVQLSDMRYNDRNVVTERVSTTVL